MAAQGKPNDAVASGGSLRRAVRLLRYFADYGTAWPVRELSEATGIPRSTVHRLLQMLAEEGLLNFDEASEQYSWGPALIRIAEAVHAGVNLGSIARPLMQALVQGLNETAVLAVYDHSRHAVVFVEEVQCSQPVRYHTQLSVPLPVHAGATGKAILAWLPADEIESIIAAGLGHVTSATVTDPAALRTDLDKIVQQGFAVSYGEREPDAVGIACPVFDASGRVVASVCVTIPRYRFAEHNLAAIASALRGTADDISRALGLPAGVAYPPDAPIVAAAGAEPGPTSMGR